MGTVNSFFNFVFSHMQEIMASGVVLIGLAIMFWGVMRTQKGLKEKDIIFVTIGIVVILIGVAIVTWMLLICGNDFYELA